MGRTGSSRHRCPRCDKILPWRDSLLFVTSNNGLSVIDIAHGYTIRNFYEEDGLHSDNFEENSGAIRNGILYAGGVGGSRCRRPDPPRH